MGALVVIIATAVTLGVPAQDAGATSVAQVDEAVTKRGTDVMPNRDELIAGLPASEPPEVAAGLDVGGALVRTFVVLGLVVALIYLTLNVGLRKLMGVAPVGAGQLVRVIERVPLDQRHALFVVKAGDEVLLLGTAEGGVQLVSKLNAAEVERMQREAATASTGSFMGALWRAKTKATTSTGEGPPTPGAGA